MPPKRRSPCSTGYHECAEKRACLSNLALDVDSPVLLSSASASGACSKPSPFTNPAPDIHRTTEHLSSSVEESDGGNAQFDQEATPLLGLAACHLSGQEQQGQEQGQAAVSGAGEEAQIDPHREICIGAVCQPRVFPNL